MYLAKRQIKVGDEVRPAGAPVPEAAEWPDRILQPLLRGGFLEARKESPAAVAPASPEVKSAAVAAKKKRKETS